MQIGVDNDAGSSLIVGVGDKAESRVPKIPAIFAELENEIRGPHLQVRTEATPTRDRWGLNATFSEQHENESFWTPARHSIRPPVWTS